MRHVQMRNGDGSLSDMWGIALSDGTAAVNEQGNVIFKAPLDYVMLAPGIDVALDPLGVLHVLLNTPGRGAGIVVAAVEFRFPPEVVERLLEFLSDPASREKNVMFKDGLTQEEP